jgi:hypothetical protein
VCVSVCLSDCPHNLIGRQPSRDFALFLYVEGCKGGGTTDCRHCTTTTGIFYVVFVVGGGAMHVDSTVEPQG